MIFIEKQISEIQVQDSLKSSECPKKIARQGGRWNDFETTQALES
jgi:hypothetical protein